MDFDPESLNVAFDDFISTNQSLDYFLGYDVQSYYFPQSNLEPHYPQPPSIASWSTLACQVEQLDAPCSESQMCEFRPYPIDSVKEFEPEPLKCDLVEPSSPCIIPTMLESPMSVRSDLTIDAHSMSSSYTSCTQQQKDPSAIQVSRVTSASAPVRRSFLCSECTKSFLRLSELR